MSIFNKISQEFERLLGELPGEQVQYKIISATKVDLGPPWGIMEIPEEIILSGLREVPAACSAAEHVSHPSCHPGWKEKVKEHHGKVIAGPLLTDRGWRALVYFDPRRTWKEARRKVGASV